MLGVVVLIPLGVIALIAGTYAPKMLGLSEDFDFFLVLGLRGLGFLLLLGAGALMLRIRREE
jgi:hypothetical protein